MYVNNNLYFVVGNLRYWNIHFQEEVLIYVWPVEKSVSLANSPYFPLSSIIPIVRLTTLFILVIIVFNIIYACFKHYLIFIFVFNIIYISFQHYLYLFSTLFILIFNIIYICFQHYLYLFSTLFIFVFNIIYICFQHYLYLFSTLFNIYICFQHYLYMISTLFIFVLLINLLDSISHLTILITNHTIIISSRKRAKNFF